MEFNVKLQELRKQKGLTQEELADALFVSRAAVSKWESGRGYPNIDSLKAIAKFFAITVDELLSGEELLTLAEENYKRNERHLRDLVFGLLDICAVLLLFLPVFAERSDGVIGQVSLLKLNTISPWLYVVYLALIIAISMTGIITLALQNSKVQFWVQIKSKLSFALNVLCTALFVVSLQPYPALLLLCFMLIKFFILVKKR